MSKLILASGSAARQKMLRNAGFEFDVMPADIDEEKIKQDALLRDTPVQEIAALLANQKAKVISNENKEDYIIGSDQILIFGGNIISKSNNNDDAIKKLKLFQGKTHYLISAVSVYKNDEEIFSYADAVAMNAKELSNTQIENYCNNAGDALTQCVGGYAYESVGIRLFESIEGDFFTVLGMPLLPLENFLASEGFGL